MPAIAKREPTAVANRELRSFPVDGDLDQLADHLREHLAKAALPLHETRIVPSGGEQYVLRRAGDSYEFGLVPRDAAPAETVQVTIEDGVATIRGPVHTPYLNLVVRGINMVVTGSISLVASTILGLGTMLAVLVVTGSHSIANAFGLGVAVLSFIAVFVNLVQQRHPDPVRLRQHRQRKVLRHVERAVRPMLRSALPGVPYR